MHAVCGYTFKCTWIKAIKEVNNVGWPILTECNVSRYYQETNETPKGHLNQSRKNVRSRKPKRTPLKVPKTVTLRRHKACDIHIRVYKVRNTVFSNQTGKSPTRSQRGNKNIMVKVQINSNAILVKSINNSKDEELTRAYQTMLLRLQRAGKIPKKHILDNEMSEALKTIIQYDYKMQLERVPPGTHSRNEAQLAICFLAHFLSVLVGTVKNVPPSLWYILPLQEAITTNMLR